MLVIVNVISLEEDGNVIVENRMALPPSRIKFAIENEDGLADFLDADDILVQTTHGYSEFLDLWKCAIVQMKRAT